ncbi:MAG: PQQ-dependent sugar dehydrogenase, partial [Thermoproteota archaeon]|nr:PQQ-dependent sugar dehydrogenase [Thermoproteota archaeon]
GIAVDPSSHNVYVADTANNRIQVFSSNGTFLSKWGGYGGYGSGNGTFNHPEGIAVEQGIVYVSDTDNHRIQVFSSNGTFLSKLGMYGILEHSRSEENLRSPSGIAVDPSSHNVYVADTANNRIVGFATYSFNNNVSFSNEDGEIYGNNTGIKLQSIYDGLKNPTAIAFLGPNDMLVLQQTNKSVIRIVNGQMLNEPALDDLGSSVKDVGCMCDIAILNYGNGTSYAFLYYYLAKVMEDDGTTKIVNRLYRYDLINGKLTNPKLFFEIPSALGTPHNGGKIMIGPDNNIYLTMGEINYYRTKAQNVKNGSLPDGSGGILRFSPDGGPVGGGLIGHTHPLDKYYAYGIRNSFGINYDPFTGNIWMTDNGADCCDELNIARPGFNSGWNKIMGKSSMEAFNPNDLEYFNGTGRYNDPIFEWFIPIGVTDLVFIPSDALGKQYKGNLFVGDINSGYLYRFLLNQSRTGLVLNGSISDGIANNNIEKREAAFANLNGSIADLEIGPDGLLYIVSFSNGKIIRLQPIETALTGAAPIPATNSPDTNSTQWGNLTAASTTNSAGS